MNVHNSRWCKLLDCGRKRFKVHQYGEWRLNISGSYNLWYSWMAFKPFPDVLPFFSHSVVVVLTMILFFGGGNSFKFLLFSLNQLSVQLFSPLLSWSFLWLHVNTYSPRKTGSGMLLLREGIRCWDFVLQFVLFPGWAPGNLWLSLLFFLCRALQLCNWITFICWTFYNFLNGL